MACDPQLKLLFTVAVFFPARKQRGVAEANLAQCGRALGAWQSADACMFSTQYANTPGQVCALVDQHLHVVLAVIDHPESRA